MVRRSRVLRSLLALTAASLLASPLLAAERRPFTFKVIILIQIVISARLMQGDQACNRHAPDSLVHGVCSE